MQEQTDKKNPAERQLERKQVGDETSNPLPDDYSSKQRLGDDSQAT